MVEGTLSFEALKLHDDFENSTIAESPLAATHAEARFYPPLSQWECLAPRGVPQEMRVAPNPVISKVALARSSTMELTRFQRFIRRMESAGPRIVLDRLKEEWQDDAEIDEEVCFTNDQTETFANHGVACARETTLASNRFPDAASSGRSETVVCHW
jgi:hypothetical protein